MVSTNKLKGRLRELGLTQQDLAQALGIRAPTINQKLNNIRPFSLEEADQVAKILKISPTDFGAYFFT